LLSTVTSMYVTHLDSNFMKKNSFKDKCKMYWIHKNFGFLQLSFYAAIGVGLLVLGYRP
jgi:hypothetical protein